MLSYILTKVRHPTVPQPRIDPEQWLHDLTRQAIQYTNRRFAVFGDNLLGLVPRMSSNGDSVVILHGSSLPFVLRPAGNGYFEMIGACFVDKIMHGARVDWALGDAFRICRWALHDLAILVCIEEHFSMIYHFLDFFYATYWGIRFDAIVRSKRSIRYYTLVIQNYWYSFDAIPN